jgi:hypothetical protein
MKMGIAKNIAFPVPGHVRAECFDEMVGVETTTMP